MKIPTLDDDVAHVKEMTRQIGEKLDPDGDWIPALIGWGDGGPVVVGFPEVDKEFWPDMLLQLAKEARLRHAVLVLSSWMVEGTPEAAMSIVMGRMQVREHPARQEVLVLEGSDGERHVTWIAEIERHEGSAPTLGEWMERIDSTGRMVRALSTAIKAWQEDTRWQQ